MDDFLKKYLDVLNAHYPSVGELPDLPSRMANLVSPEVVQLPKSVYEKISVEIKKIYAYAHSNAAVQLIPTDKEILHVPTKNTSVLMAYDFHVNLSAGQISLIEINTNASSFLIADTLYALEKTTGPWGNSRESLKASFTTEAQSFALKMPPHMAIVDDHPPQQKMYAEFLMYRDLFKSWGWPTEIYDVEDVPLDKINFIYNRSTDFLLSEERTKKLRSAYLNRKVLFSPQPKEYLVLARKDRLIDFSRNQISDVLIPTESLKNYPDPDELWARRKNLFFKPKNMYGAKAAYRGSSISKKTFYEVLSHDFIAQEFRPPGEFGDWKFDLRFYVYQNEIQLACARLYKGQVTNFATPGGGIARLTFV